MHYTYYLKKTQIYTYYVNDRFCEIEEKNENVFCPHPPPPQQKVGTGAPIPTNTFLVYYNIMKHLVKFEQ